VLQTLEGDKRITKSEIERAETLIQEWEKEYRKELEKEKKHHTLLKKLNLCEDALKILKLMKMELISEVRETIESKTKEYFLSLIWKKDTYSEVKIDNNYRVSVLSKLGSESLGSLSAGERQILALSFMAALREISGFDMPVIIDTPLGRISGEPKDNVAQSLPEYLTDTQVTLLVTDQEYTPSVKKLLSRRIGKEYELKFNEIDSETQVIETEVSPYAE
jgi:DNA sulfur modification protein DndD